MSEGEYEPFSPIPKVSQPYGPFQLVPDSGLFYDMVQIFQYENSEVTFRNESGVAMVNATEMAKSFGKQPSDWLRLKGTETFLVTLEGVRGIPRTVLISILHGGAESQGTWVHEDVALEFARWLSPKFAIWCNDRIKELLRYGFTATDAKIEEIIANPDLLITMATQLKKERAELLREKQERERAEQENELLSVRLELQERVVKEAAPKVKLYDEVMQSEGLISTTVVAKDLGLPSARLLNQKLKEKGVQYRVGGMWVLYSKYQGQGYTKTKTTPYVDSQGNPQASIATYWTQEGRKFIHGLFK